MNDNVMIHTSRDNLVAAFKRWYEDERRGLCLTNEEVATLSVDQAATRCADNLIEYLSQEVLVVRQEGSRIVDVTLHSAEKT